ncbi:MAG: hypothetical protein CL677_01325 [Bdellovibrionaceae bacterium]|nr:hypothetical protein [Pseudobdellovibrionaceae bacterium]|tara:strand:+ start:115220 stop:116551 length:1332 start_codon:yes stop_codon:yes gene_type:complete
MKVVLNYLINNLTLWLDPNYKPNKKRTYEKSQILAVFVVVFIPMLIGFAVATYFKLNHYPLIFWEVSSGIGIFVGAYAYRKTQSFELASNIMIGSGVAIIVAASYYTGGIHSDLLFWSCIAPMCSGMANGRRGIVIWAAIVMGCMLALFLGDAYVQKSPHLITDTELLHHFRYRAIFGTLILSSIVTYIYMGIIKEAIESAAEKELKIRNLLKILSHDLSTPLMVIGGISKRILKKDPSKEEILTHVRRISTSADRIQSILETVREMEAAHSGKKSIVLEPVGLKACLEEAISGLEERLKEKHLKVFVDVDLSDDLKVLADSSILANQVFTNLLSNAIKFSQQGEHIVVQSRVKDDVCEVKIQDFGIGIPKDLQEQLFEMSKSTSRPGTDGEKGTGFGLPLVKMFMLSFQGDIHVVSKIKGRTGTTMILTFAVAKENGQEFAA